MTEREDDFLDLNSGDDVADPRKRTGGLIIACAECPTPVFQAMFGGKSEIIPSIFIGEDGELQNFRDFPALAAKLGRFPTLAEAETYQAELIAAEDARRAPAVAAGWDAFDLAEVEKLNPNRAR
jgi:hypothetical protein